MTETYRDVKLGIEFDGIPREIPDSDHILDDIMDKTFKRGGRFNSDSDTEVVYEEVELEKLGEGHYRIAVKFERIVVDPSSLTTRSFVSHLHDAVEHDIDYIQNPDISIRGVPKPDLQVYDS